MTSKITVETRVHADAQLRNDYAFGERSGWQAILDNFARHVQARR